MNYCLQCEKEYPDSKSYCNIHGSRLENIYPGNPVGEIFVGKYKIEELVGVGGFGVVFKANQIELDRPVALKLLRKGLQPVVLKMFKKEARLVAMLDHENIVTIYEADSLGKIPYIAMQWLEGHTLKKELSINGKLSFERTADILRQITAALEVAHNNLVVHRDLKPENVMLVKRPDGSKQVKVVDFGLAKVLSAATGSRISVVGGTQYYASPEQLIPRSNIDTRADIYALGVMLYEMLTGILPSTQASLRKLRPDAPLELEELVNRMMARDPAHRPQSVSEIPPEFERVYRLHQSQGELLYLLKVALQKFHDFLEKAEMVVRQLWITALTKLRLVAGTGAMVLLIGLAGYLMNLSGGDPRGILPSPTVAPSLTPTVVVTPEPVSPVVEVLRYRQEFNSRGQFRLRFTARQGGYIYLIGVGEQNRTVAFLTGQRAKACGKTENRLQPSTSLRYPCGGKWLTPLEDSARFTLIFSPEPLPHGFLNAPDIHYLTESELNVLQQLRSQSELRAPEAKANGNSEIVSARSGRGGPLVHDFMVRTPVGRASPLDRLAR